jgi:hypothetical protein
MTWFVLKLLLKNVMQGIRVIDPVSTTTGVTVRVDNCNIP